MKKDDDPPTREGSTQKHTENTTPLRSKNGPVAWLKTFVRKKPSNGNDFQGVLDDFIEDLEETTDMDKTSVDNQKLLITNILKTHDLRVEDVMVPRADIVAVEQNITLHELRDVFRGNQFSRIPVYNETLDNVVGVLHIKDLLMCFLEKRECSVLSMKRDVSFVSPRMPVMDLFLNLREDKKHMALVIDEHGGIDGLVTINDIVEAVMGDIEDEFDNDEQPQIIEKPDGSIVVDARFEIDEFEEKYGQFLTNDEREDVETIGGLAFHLAGHVPKKGDIFHHSTGITLEILDANASRVKNVKIRNLHHPIPSADEV